MAMLEDLKTQEKPDSATIIHYAHTIDHAAFAHKLHIAGLDSHYILLTADTPISKATDTGKLNTDLHIYVSSSESFVTVVDKVLAECGHSKGQIHTEAIEPTLSILNRCC